MYLVSSDESDSLHNESDRLGSESVSSGTYSFCTFSLGFDDSVGSVSVLGYDVFAPTVVKSKGDIFHLMCLDQQESSPKVVDSLKCFGAQIPYFCSKFENRIYSYSHSQTLHHSPQPL